MTSPDTDPHKDVATESATVSAMVKAATLPRTLMGGTEAMRKAGETYLPKEPAESQAAYSVRKSRSTLFNAFGKTVADMTGKVFTKPVVLKDNVPEKLQAYAENIDLAGRHINVFARDVFYDGMQTGIGFILTDMPPAVQRNDGKVVTLADEQKAGIRPYLVYIPLERLKGWISTTVDGAETLLQVRISECVTERDGLYLEKEIEQVRVIEPGTWQTFRKDSDGKWQPYQNGTTSLQKITLVPFYTNRTGFMTGSPPLANLADTNVAHWQSQSDQRNILHVARVPILFGAGFAEDVAITLGVNTAIRSSDANATLTFVEHSGAAIGAGDKDLTNLEMQMQAMGLQLLIDDPGQSATGEMRDDSKENSPLAMMARSLKDALETSLGFMAEYEGLGEDKGGEVDVNTDFGIMAGAGVDVPNILAAQSSGLISKKTAWSELQRRNFLSDDFDPELEQGLIDAEPPPLGMEVPPGGGMKLDDDEKPPWKKPPEK